MTKLKQIKIGPYKYDIKIEDDPRNDNGDSLYGEVHHVRRVIRLNAENDQLQMAATTLHECLHIWDDLFGAALGESTVTGLGSFIILLFAENPALLDEIKAAIK